MFMKFLKYYDKYQKRDRFAEVKQHAMWFAKYIDKAKSIRVELMKAKTKEDIKKIYFNLTTV